LVVDAVPFQMTRVGIDPEYISKPGWNSPSVDKKTVKELPAKMLEYVEFINKFVGAPITYISNGPGREQIVKVWFSTIKNILKNFGGLKTSLKFYTSNQVAFYGS